MDFYKNNRSDLPVIVIDKNYNIIDINKKAEEKYGNIKGTKCYRANVTGLLMTIHYHVLNRLPMYAL